MNEKIEYIDCEGIRIIKNHAIPDKYYQYKFPILNFWPFKQIWRKNKKNWRYEVNENIYTIMNDNVAYCSEMLFDRIVEAVKRKAEILEYKNYTL